jgi:hypothetical protein
MKKYYKANLGGGVRSIIADTTTGRISLFYIHNNLHIVNEGIYSTTIEPGESRSEFEKRLEIFDECTLSDIQANFTLIKNHINSL